MVQYTAILTMAEYDLSNGAIFNDLERLLFLVSRSRCSLTPNMQTFQWNTNMDLYTPYQIVSFLINLE